jgi:hypothetical protein
MQHSPQHQIPHQQPTVVNSGSGFSFSNEFGHAGALSPPAVARGRQLAALRGGLSAEQEQRAVRAKAEQAAFLAQQIAEKEARKKKEKEEAAELERKEQLRIERELAIEVCVFQPGSHRLWLPSAWLNYCTSPLVSRRNE